MSNRLWVLGAADPEMAAIERLLRDAGEEVIYAVGGDGKRVNPGTAYGHPRKYGEDNGETLYFVECDGQAKGPSQTVIVIDHHRPGDPGYGRPPEEYLGASSIGQVLRQLFLLGVVSDDAGDAPNNDERLLVAAADHCLEAAYRGRCPGVDPDALMRWRAESRAAFQGRTVEAVLADVEAARKRLREAVSRVETEHPMGGGVVEHHLPDATYADLRGQSIPELPEAAAREGIAFLATVRDRDGREKIVLQAATPELVRRFMAGEIVPGLKDVCGDPARGFAGGYVA